VKRTMELLCLQNAHGENDEKGTARLSFLLAEPPR